LLQLIAATFIEAFYIFFVQLKKGACFVVLALKFIDTISDY